MTVFAKLKPGESMTLDDGTILQAGKDRMQVVVLWGSSPIQDILVRKDDAGSFLLSKCPLRCLGIWDEELEAVG